MTNKENKKVIIRRFNVISGQILAISKMIDSNRDCKDISIQIKAVKSAFNKVSEEFIKFYLKDCVKDSKLQDFEEVLELMSKY